MLYFLEESPGFVEELVVFWSSFSGAGFDAVGTVGDEVISQGAQEGVEVGTALSA